MDRRNASRRGPLPVIRKTARGSGEEGTRNEGEEEDGDWDEDEEESSEDDGDDDDDADDVWCFAPLLMSVDSVKFASSVCVDVGACSSLRLSIIALSYRSIALASIVKSSSAVHEVELMMSVGRSGRKWIAVGV